MILQHFWVLSQFFPHSYGENLFPCIWLETRMFQLLHVVLSLGTSEKSLVLPFPHPAQGGCVQPDLSQATASAPSRAPLPICLLVLRGACACSRSLLMPLWKGTDCSYHETGVPLHPSSLLTTINAFASRFSISFCP